MRRLLPLMLALMLIFSPEVLAKDAVFTGKGTYVTGTSDTIESSKKKAVEEALADVSKQAASAVRGRIQRSGGRITYDVVVTATRSVIRLTDDPKYEYGISPEGTPSVTAVVTATVDVDQARTLSQKLMDEVSGLPPDNDTKAPRDSKARRTPDWWENGMLTASGYGVPPASAANPGQARSLALKAAKMDAYRNLAEKARGIHITADETVVEGAVDAVITGARIVSEEYDEYGNSTVVMTVPVYGVKNSLAKAALKPVEKEAFPAPSDDAGVAEGGYTGLIIDCRDLVEDTKKGGRVTLNPVLSPVIRDSSRQTIYGYSNLDYDKVVSRGMVGYSEDMSENIKRAGSRPLIVKASELTDESSSPVLSPVDADKILVENRLGHFLDDCRVVLVGYRVAAPEEDEMETYYYGTGDGEKLPVY